MQKGGVMTSLAIHRVVPYRELIACNRIYWRIKVHVAFQDMGRAQAGKSIYKAKSNVSSAYVLKSDMDLYSPVDAYPKKS